MRIVVLLSVSILPSVAQESSRTLQFERLRAPAELSETATVIRSVADIRELNVDIQNRRLAVRGDAAQAALAEWLFPRLDTPSETRELEYTISEDNDKVRVFYISHAKGDELREMTTMIRALLEIRRGFLSQSARAFVIRCTPDEAAAAAWLVDALDQPEFGAVRTEWNFNDPQGDETIRLFHVRQPKGPAEFQSLASELKKAAGVRSLFTYYPLRLIGVRSTRAQLEETARLLASM